MREVFTRHCKKRKRLMHQVLNNFWQMFNCWFMLLMLYLPLLDICDWHSLFYELVKNWGMETSLDLIWSKVIWAKKVHSFLPKNIFYLAQKLLQKLIARLDGSLTSWKLDLCIFGQKNFFGVKNWEANHNQPIFLATWMLKNNCKEALAKNISTNPSLTF